LKKVKTTVWDPAEYLETEEEIIAYLSDIFATNDAQLIATAIGDIARARGMSMIAENVDRGRESLYKSLSQTGNPSFDTIIRVMSALGYTLQPVHM